VAEHERLDLQERIKQPQAAEGELQRAPTVVSCQFRHPCRRALVKFSRRLACKASPAAAEPGRQRRRMIELGSGYRVYTGAD
jgi:hypothetical protein